MSEETVGEKEVEAQCQRRNEEEKAEPLSKLLRQKVIEVESLRKALSKERDRLCRSENENRKLREKLNIWRYKEEKADRSEKKK